MYIDLYIYIYTVFYRCLCACNMMCLIASLHIDVTKMYLYCLLVHKTNPSYFIVRTILWCGCFMVSVLHKFWRVSSHFWEGYVSLCDNFPNIEVTEDFEATLKLRGPLAKEFLKYIQLDKTRTVMSERPST